MNALFEKVWDQTSHYFWDSPEVVVKVSSQEASTFQRVHIYAQAFADEWNGLRGREEIDFNWIVSVNLPDFEGTQTIEPYLNKKLYQDDDHPICIFLLLCRARTSHVGKFRPQSV